MKTQNLLLLALAWILVGCAAQPSTVAPTQTKAQTSATLRLATTDLAFSLARDLAHAYGEQHGVTVQVNIYTLPELGQVLQARQADLVLAVNPPLTEFAAPLGFVTMQLVAHPSNPVHTLPASAAQAAFDGQITQWNGLGGAEAPINIWVREDGSDGALAFEQRLLSASAATLQARIAPTWQTLRESVAADPHALSYLPESEITPAVQPVQLDAEMRLLVAAYTLAEPTGHVHDFVVWAQSQPGQMVVETRHIALMP